MNNLQNSEKDKENFAQLLDDYFEKNPFKEGQIIKAEIVNVASEYVTLDAGLKSEARVLAKEFADDGDKSEIEVGKVVEVYVEKLENMTGEVVLSRARVRQEESLNTLEQAFQDKKPVTGYITHRVKGGFIVKIQSTNAFLPGSHLDMRPLKDPSHLMEKQLEFAILRIDKARGNVIISRKVELEKTLGVNREKIIEKMHEGQILEGVVKNITDYGAFIDLGGIDGLLHIIDISWKRTRHPEDVFAVNDKIKVCVTKINPENSRISLGMKQLQDDPWKQIEEKIKIGQKVKGKVTNVTGYGAFVEIEYGVEGLIHVTEMSWTKKNIQVDKLLKVEDEVEAIVLEIEKPKRRISLSMKRCEKSPWNEFLQKYPINSKVSGKVKNLTEFGLFIGLENELDGMIHVTDLDWNKTNEKSLEKYTKGMEIEAVVLAVDSEKERISLGIKQLQEDQTKTIIDKTKKGDVITCEIKAVDEKGVYVTVASTIESYIKRNALSQDKAEQNPHRFAIGEKTDAMVIAVDTKKRKISLSIKELEIKNEKNAMEQYGSADSGASLGDILGKALLVRKQEDQQKIESQKKLDENKEQNQKENDEKKASE